MPTADATLLPPALPTGCAYAEESDSVRHLEEVGVEAVLGAMIEQKRRASQPSFPSFTPPQADNDLPSERRANAKSEVFLKAR